MSRATAESSCSTNRRVLMIAYHFPPMKGSSGLQRTLNFTRYLPQHGWEARLLTVWPAAYPATGVDQLDDVPTGLRVRRLPCLDAARHLAIRGKYPDAAARPDRWSSWALTAIPVGLLDCLLWKPHAIWTTFPIATAVVIGRRLAQFSRKPWVLDLRDSMTEEHYPVDPRLRRALRFVEDKAVHEARAVVFTSPGARAMYAARYPDVPDSKWAGIANGYDEDMFRRAEQGASAATRSTTRIELLHSGLLDPVDRDPLPFFETLALLRSRGLCSGDSLRITLRATGHDRHYRGILAKLGIDDIIRLAPPVGYQDALKEMLAADGLLVFQASNCNHQTPAKLYEYLRAGRPIFALTDSGGDTARVLRMAGFGADCIAPIGNSERIAGLLTPFLAKIRDGTATRPESARVRQWSRAEQTASLAKLLDGVVDQ